MFPMEDVRVDEIKKQGFVTSERSHYTDHYYKEACGSLIAAYNMLDDRDPNFYTIRWFLPKQSAKEELLVLLETATAFDLSATNDSTFTNADGYVFEGHIIDFGDSTLYSLNHNY